MATENKNSTAIKNFLATSKILTPWQHKIKIPRQQKIKFHGNKKNP
jgi:hypothetical protein